MTSPFRDENESLRGENERLRRALEARRRRRRPLAALLTVAADFGAVVLLRPWLNASDDLHFWLAITVLVGLGALALFFALGPGDDRNST